MRKLIATSTVLLSMAIMLPLMADGKEDWKDKKKIVAREYAKRVRLYHQRLEVGRALIEVQSTNWPSIIPYYTDEMEYHDPIVDIYGIDVMSAFLARLFTASADLVTTVEDETCVNGVYMASWTMVGQFTGVPYEAKGMSTIKFLPGEARVFYQRDYYTEGDIMANIPGLDQAIEGFRTYYKCAVDPTFECPPLELPQ